MLSGSWRRLLQLTLGRLELLQGRLDLREPGIKSTTSRLCQLRLFVPEWSHATSIARLLGSAGFRTPPYSNQ